MCSTEVCLPSDGPCVEGCFAGECQPLHFIPTVCNCSHNLWFMNLTPNQSTTIFGAPVLQTFVNFLLVAFHSPKAFFPDPINVKSWEKVAELDKAQLIIIVLFVWQMYSLNSNCKTIKLWKSFTCYGGVLKCLSNRWALEEKKTENLVISDCCFLWICARVQLVWTAINKLVLQWLKWTCGHQLHCCLTHFCITGSIYMSQHCI